MSAIAARRPSQIHRAPAVGRRRLDCALGFTGLLLAIFLPASTVHASGRSVGDQFHQEVQPILAQYCYDCHGDGSHKGNVALDQFPSDAALSANPDLWWRVLKNVRAGIMPPRKKTQPSGEEKAKLFDWIKFGAFGIDSKHVDPGRVTLRRLNRVEYRNTIHDLMGMDYNTTEEFPPDDTGYGFDTIGDVLTVSPLLLEKYMRAAESIVAQAVPIIGKVPPQVALNGRDFRRADGTAAPERLSFYKDAELAGSLKVEHPGEYRIVTELTVLGEFDFDPGRCDVVFKLDDHELVHETLAWVNRKTFRHEATMQLDAGDHRLAFSLHPLTPIEQKKTSVDLRIESVRAEGPADEKFWIAPRNYRRFFLRSKPPQSSEDRKAYAREVLSVFATRAFRRPIDDRTLDRLVKLAEQTWSQPGKRFEEGIAQAMVPVLASPRFVFRVEKTVEHQSDAAYSPVDEYALASRLSYFLWSTMPDDQLFDLAGRGELRANLPSQLKRMLADPRSQAFVKNFVGQWLQVRDVDGISIDARTVLARDAGQEKELQRQIQELRARFRKESDAKVKGERKPIDRKKFFLLRPATEMNEALRQAMRDEVDLYFDHVVHDDRSVLELLDSDYTFLNEKLAKHYGVPGVQGAQMRLVHLPPDSPRGGVLSMGSTLLVTSNPTRTSPVKRGQFILDNIIGMPAPPPPADIPALEESEKRFSGHEPTVREVLEIHRNKPLCSSCHSRMDPLGLAFENFNAMGMWRTAERGQTIEPVGTLLTGESFHGARELKEILRNNHRRDFYRCLSEKLLTYALGRGLDYYDVETVDRIVDRLEKDDGRFSALLTGVIESAPFQERRNLDPKSSEPTRGHT